MITGGLPTVFVSDMDRAIRFFTATLGLTLEQRFGNAYRVYRNSVPAVIPRVS